MRVGDVLHRRPVTKPFPAVSRAATLKRANQTEQRVVGPFEILPYLGKKHVVERNGPAGNRELASRRGGDQPEFRLRLGEHDHDLNPARHHRGIVEERTQFGRGPGISIDG